MIPQLKAALLKIANKVYTKGYDDGAAKYVRADAKSAYLTPEQAVDAIQPEIERLELVARIKAQIETYQRLMFWLEDQDDTEALVRLAKDIDVELVKLRAQLTQSNQKKPNL